MTVANAQPRYEYGSPEWLAAFQATMAAIVAVAAQDIPDLTFSMSEISQDPPEHLGGAGGEVGWSCFVENGRLVRFTFDSREPVDYRLNAKYRAMIQFARFEIGDAPERKAEYDALTKRLADAGEVSVEGRMPRLPRVFGRIHDVVARFTA
jgi:hypothetical protein